MLQQELSLLGKSGETETFQFNNLLATLPPKGPVFNALQPMQLMLDLYFHLLPLLCMSSW